MISRRSFLKMAGLSTVAIGAGFTSGKFIANKPVYYAAHGFIPDDEQIIKKLVHSFRNKVKSNSQPIIISDSKIGEIINRYHAFPGNESYTAKGSITYRIKRLKNKVDSDIIISDGNNTIYSLEDFNSAFFNLRNDLANKKAEYFITAEYTETNFISNLFNGFQKKVLIENENGIIENISLGKNYKNILVEGPIGKTGLSIENGFVRVHTASCRNKICQHSYAGTVGNIIACAPNKVLIRIVNT